MGTMHYNPVSLQRVGATVDALAEAKLLDAVVIESCATRYAKWKDMPATSLQRRFLESEMQVASDRCVCCVCARARACVRGWSVCVERVHAHVCARDGT